MELLEKKLLFILLSICLQLIRVKSYKYVMLTSPFAPMVYCEIGDTEKSKFSGLDIDMFNQIAKVLIIHFYSLLKNSNEVFIIQYIEYRQQLNWSDSDYSYECIDYNQMNVKMQKWEQYIGFIGGLTIDSKREQEGFTFSYPMWNTGASIILYNKNEFWLQIEVLTVQICGLVVATALLIGVLHFFLEKKECSLEQFLWNAMTSIFFITTINLKRSGSRVIQISFWFMIMIISSTYMAKMTNILTIEYPLYQIRSPYGLNGKRVITYTIYNNQLYQYGAIPLTSDFGSQGDDTYDDITTENIVNNLSREDDYKVDAYVIDDVQAQYSEYSNCNLYIVGKTFYQFNYGIGFYKDQKSDVIPKINKEIQKITINQSSERLISDYIAKSQRQCIKDSNDDAVTMQHVGGLFVIQAVAIAVAILIFLITKVPIYQRLKKKLIKYNIVSERKNSVKDTYGDELVLQNIKQVTKEQVTNFEQLIEDRLDEMDENIIKFYQILLNDEQLRKLKIIPDDKNKKDVVNSLQISSKNDDANSLPNISMKKIEKKESTFSVLHHEQLQVSKKISEKHEAQKDKNNYLKVDENEVVELSHEQDSNYQQNK